MSADLIGRTLAHFRIVEKLGQGGMGVVYKAMDDKLLRQVALKVLSPKHVGNEERRRRFLTEAQSAAAVTHANIATVYEVGEAEGLVFIAMELVEGQTLRKFLERGALPIPDALAIARRIARALAKAHERGIVHRDLKPDNVMIGEDLDVKVLDFGLAKLRQSPGEGEDVQAATADTLMRLTQEGSVLGTPGYMSPEQAAGTALDHRTDIFSLGVILYEMVTGVRPFQGRSPMEVIIAINRDGYEPAWRLNPAVSQELDAIINTCLAKSPDDRYGSARELQRDLERLRGDTGSQLSMSQVSLHELNAGAAASTASRRFPSVPGLVTTQRRRRPRRWLSGWAVAAVLLIALSIGAIRRLAPSPAKPVSANPEAAELYETALQDWRRGLESACGKLAQAAEKDPRLGAAHLRFAICESVGTPSLARQSFQRAEALRPSLTERDRQLLDAYEPVFQRQPSDFPETQRRLRALASRYPKDAEIAWWLGNVTTQLVDFRQAVEAYDQALKLDPSLASAWRFRGQMLAYLGDFDGALESIARCLELSPGATACLRERITIDEERGDCAAVEANARRWLTIEPDLQLPYRFLAEALMGQGRRLETVREALKQKWSVPVPPGSNGAVIELQDTQRMDILAGRLAAAIAGAERELELVSSSKREVDHARPAARLVALYEEIGKPGEALRVAESFLARRDAWESDPRGDDWAISKDPTATMLGVLRRTGALPKEKVDAQREARLAWWQPKAAPNTRNFLWIHQYAKGVETEEAAKEALAVLPRYEPLPPYKPEVPADAHIGQTFFLGGRVDEALSYLERMVRSCYALQHPIEHTRSAYFLGLARETKGDKSGACAAYALVHERWGNAQPRSLTGKKASERMKALSCR